MSLSSLAPLLASDDPAPVDVLAADGSTPLLIVCDHAGRAVPRALDGLGVSPADLERHIAWDIGAGDVSRRLGEVFNAPVIAATYSRLVIDLNRYPWDASSCPEESDGTRVPANRNLDPAARERRVVELFRPYHERIAQELDVMLEQGRTPFLLSVHTMTESLQRGGRRSQEVTICHVGDDPAAVAALDLLEVMNDVVVGDNDPYSLDIGVDYTVPEHAIRRGLPALQVEFRQDLVATSVFVEHWVERFAPVLEHLLEKRTRTPLPVR